MLLITETVYKKRSILIAKYTERHIIDFLALKPERGNTKRGNIIAMMTYTVTFLLLYDFVFFLFVLNKAITTALSAYVSLPQRSIVSPTP